MNRLNWIDEMQLCGRVETGTLMKELTTMRVGGAADCVVYAKNIEDIKKVVRGCAENGVPLTVVGRGSNLIVRDGGLRGVVLQLGKDFGSIAVEENHITAQAGATLGALSRAALENGLEGLEFAEGIPGSVGGGVYMNAGAYGGEMVQVLTKVCVLQKDGTVAEMSKEELDMRYRHTKLMELGCVVLEAEFELKQGDKVEIAARMADFSQRRREKQPIQYPSSGSFFKRPEGYFAGKLIQDAGLKGATIGGAQISELHAGFMINIGNATAGDILNLMEKVQNEVMARFGVQLEPEVRIIGEE